MTQNETRGAKGVRGRTPWLHLLAAVLVVALAGGFWAWRYGRPLADAVQSYVYAFPHVVMDLTREAATAPPRARSPRRRTSSR